MSGFDLADYVPYLLNRAGSRIADSFAAVARAEGLSLAMWRVLAALRQAEPMPVGRIAALTAIEVSTVSRVVSALERRGLAQRQRSRDDNRVVLVARTEAGRAVTERLVPVALDYAKVATAGLREEEVAVLKRLLRRLYDNMAGLDAVRPATGR